MKKIIRLTVIIISLFLIIQPSAAVINAYFDDLAGFNTAAGSPPIVVNFDSVAKGTDISGATFGGITFDKGNMPAPSAPLIVIDAADSYSDGPFNWFSVANKLIATSGSNVLSPGGVQLEAGEVPELENDDLNMTFADPVNAAGFDLLYQSKDGASYVGITVYDSGDNVLYSNSFIPVGVAPDSAGGPEFVGFVSDSKNIKKIAIDEYDNNSINPDSNIGFDTIRAPREFIPSPEFPTVFLPVTMIIGFLGTVLLIQRTREH
jgi:hypothetical protein